MAFLMLCRDIKGKVRKSCRPKARTPGTNRWSIPKPQLYQIFCFNPCNLSARLPGWCLSMYILIYNFQIVIFEEILYSDLFWPKDWPWRSIKTYFEILKISRQRSVSNGMSPYSISMNNSDWIGQFLNPTSIQAFVGMINRDIGKRSNF